MTKITVPARPEARRYINRIADKLVNLFGISREEAVGRINRFWSGKAFATDVDLLVLLHQTEEYWAKTIYYGPDSEWWLSETGLSPRPYP